MQKIHKNTQSPDKLSRMPPKFNQASIESDYSVPKLRQRIKSYQIETISVINIDFRADDEFLSRFLSVSGFDENGNQNIDGAFKIYKNYHSCLLSVNQLHPAKPESNFNQTLQVLLDFIAVPSENPLHFYGFDSKHRAVLGYITKQVNPNKPDVLLGQLLASLVIVEYLQKKFSKKIKQHGMIMIMDHGGLNLAHYHKFITNPFMLKLFADFYSTAIPIEIHQQAVVNEAGVTKLLFALARPFIATEMTEKIQFYGVGYENIVEELGGREFSPDFLEGGELKAEVWPGEVEIGHFLRDCLPKLSRDKVINEF